MADDLGFEFAAFVASRYRGYITVNTDENNTYVVAAEVPKHALNSEKVDQLKTKEVSLPDINDIWGETPLQKWIKSSGTLRYNSGSKGYKQFVGMINNNFKGSAAHGAMEGRITTESNLAVKGNRYSTPTKCTLEEHVMPLPTFNKIVGLVVADIERFYIDHMRYKPDYMKPDCLLQVLGRDDNMKKLAKKGSLKVLIDDILGGCKERYAGMPLALADYSALKLQTDEAVKEYGKVWRAKSGMSRHERAALDSLNRIMCYIN